MWIESVTLTGQRSQLVPMTLADTKELFEISRDPTIWQFLPVRQPETAEDMAAIVRAAIGRLDAGLELPFVIRDQMTGRLVGSTRMYDFLQANRQLEIGWTWLTPSVWRTRINSECKYLLLRHCFETLNTERVQIKTDSRNLRSQTAIARLGAVYEGTLRRHKILHDGWIRDTVVFSVVRPEWPDVKTRLEGFLQGP